MSTEYVLWTDGPVTLSAVESSAHLSIDIFDKRSPLQEVVVEQLDSDAVLQISCQTTRSHILYLRGARADDCQPPQGNNAALKVISRVYAFGRTQKA